MRAISLLNLYKKINNNFSMKLIVQSIDECSMIRLDIPNIYNHDLNINKKKAAPKGINNKHTKLTQITITTKPPKYVYMNTKYK